MSPQPSQLASAGLDICVLCVLLLTRLSMPVSSQRIVYRTVLIDLEPVYWIIG